MGNRGKNSVAALAIAAPAADAVHRHKPPHDLTDEEVEEWMRIVNTEPADKFALSAVPLLAQYCRHIVQSRRCWELRERLISKPKTDLTDVERVFRMIDRESKALAMLATKLCLSPKATTNFRGNKKPLILDTPWSPANAG